MIRIVNPRPGCAQFTSARAAFKYVERKKIARWADESRTSIFLYHDSVRLNEVRNTIREAKSAARRLGKISFWNGDDLDELATHRPGEVRC